MLAQFIQGSRQGEAKPLRYRFRSRRRPRLRRLGILWPPLRADTEPESVGRRGHALSAFLRGESALHSEPSWFHDRSVSRTFCKLHGGLWPWRGSNGPIRGLHRFSGGRVRCGVDVIPLSEPEQSRNCDDSKCPNSSRCGISIFGNGRRRAISQPRAWVGALWLEVEKAPCIAHGAFLVRRRLSGQTRYICE